MKKLDIFCASQTATAIRHNNSPSSTPSSSALLLPGGAAAIDRHNPIIRDPKRAPKTLPGNPHPPKSQKPHHSKQKSQLNGDAKVHKNDIFNGGVAKKIWKCTNPGEFISPPGSSRFLLTERAASSDPSSSDSNAGAGAKKQEISEVVKKTEDALFQGEKPPSFQGPEQVVVMRVSLHCRGCEKKLRKHLSRMEGVSSFDIEFAAKKVTVTGNVSPVNVLTSISKVKNAQLWSPTISSPIPNLSNSDQIKNDPKKLVHEFAGQGI